MIGVRYKPHKYHIITIIVIVIFVFLQYISFKNPAESIIILKDPNIQISSDRLMQADTLLVVVKNEPNNVTGKLGKLKLHFFRSEDSKNWVAAVGMHVNKKPGDYDLSISVPGKREFIKTITVSKKKFTESQLVITKELSEKGYSDKKIVSSISTKENKDLKEAFDSFTKNVYSAKAFIYPLSEIQITGSFGDIRKSKNYSIQHLGVDLKASMGTPIYAVNDGKIILQKNYYSYGNTLVLDHGLGVYSVYLHLSDFKVKQGQIVKQGDIIGFAGDTGYAIGPHLHFSIKVRGATLDPLKFIKTTQKLSYLP